MLGTYEERTHALRELYPVWTDETVWTRFAASADRFSGEPFLLFEDTRIPYRDVRLAAERMAACLWALGVRPGSKVALMMRNRPETVELIFALARISAVRVPVHICAGNSEVCQILQKADCMLLICEFPVSLPRDEMPLLKTVVCMEPGGAAEMLPWDRFLSMETSVETLPAPERDPRAMTGVLFTSGSTSAPKGVMVTHDMVLRSAFGTVRRRHMEIGRRIFMPIPLYHTMAYVEVLLTTMLVGGATIMMQGKFQAAHALELMQLHRANDIVCVPDIMINLLRCGKPRKEDFPALHALYWAGSCAPSLWKEAADGFGVDDITTAYGMTECGSTTAMRTPLDPLRDGNHGTVKPGVNWDGGAQIDVKICDTESGVEVPPGTSGELWCRGATVTPGYYKDPEATRRAMEQGWFRTGDICVMTADGRLTFLGRCDDMYKINGENVSPQFVDSVLSRCPLIRAAETVGISHPKYGQIGVTFIDTYAPYAAVEEQIRLYCAQNLAGYQIPKYFLPSDHTTWPRTKTSKVQKARLREIAAARLAEDEF